VLLFILRPEGARDEKFFRINHITYFSSNSNYGDFHLNWGLQIKNSEPKAIFFSYKRWIYVKNRRNITFQTIFLTAKSVLSYS